MSTQMRMTKKEDGDGDLLEKKIILMPCAAWKTAAVNGINENYPEIWKVGNVSDVASFTNGYPFKSEQFSDSGLIKIIKMKDINDQQPTVFLKGKLTEKMPVVDYGDLVLAMSGTISISEWKSGRVLLNQRMLKVKRDESKNTFVKMKLSEALKKISSLLSATTVKNLSLPELKKFEISIPSPTEQRLISTILTTQETLISNQKAYITAQKQLLTYLMDNLLSGRLRVRAGESDQVELYENTEWKSVSVNGKITDVPVEWKRGVVSDVANFIGGHPFKSSEFGESGSIKIIKIRDLESQNPKTYFVGVQNKKMTTVNPGDLIFGMDGDFNISEWKSQKALLNQRMVKVHINPSVNGYVKSILGRVLQYINDRTAATTVKHLSLPHLKKTEILVPSQNEQHLISAILTTQETLISKLEAKLDLEQQKMTWLLDNLLSGKYLVTEAH